MAYICGCYFILPPPATQPYLQATKKYLPVVSLKSHTTIVSSSSRTTLTQTFVNPQDKPIDEVRYTFPLYDGVSVVGFVCTVNDRVIRGVVKEKEKARQVYQEAVDRGETAGLLEQLPEASDVFTTTVGNIPAGASVKVDITYLGELKHDAEADGIRFTIPTSIAPRYGSYPGELLKANTSAKGGIEVVVDVEIPMRDGNYIKTIKSPSHPVGFELKPAVDGDGMSLAKAEISIDTLELDKDIVVVVVPAKADAPIAVLEKHPTIPDQRALMATFVPRFNLPSSRPEIVFVCDRSGSMGMGKRIPNLITALQVFLKSLPVGVKFNIVSFGSHYSFLFNKSESYGQASLDKAMKHVSTFDDGYGGTEMYAPIQEVFKRRYPDMDLEVFLLTDGEIWDQERLFGMVNKNVAEAKGAIRLFTLGIGNDVSHSLIEGLARAGNGFSQAVSDDEKMSAKVVRMLKGALSPHISDFRLEIKYGGVEVKQEKEKDKIDVEGADGGDDDDFELVEKVEDALVISLPDESPPKYTEPDKPAEKKPPTSLFDPSADPDADVDMKDAGSSATEPKYAHVPPVPIPKFIQAPFKLPPMYNFNRVCVYVLLGPSADKRTPTAVLLRGTSASHGPVELSIPVTALAQPGETIHQLAARKAVGDLEEGRGWLAHARDDSTENKQLLSEKFPGRFADMVEREAVRLGVAFQVGGKWCSFVAVDTSQDKAQAEKSAQRDAQGEVAAEEQKVMMQEFPAMACRKLLPDELPSLHLQGAALRGGPDFSPPSPPLMAKGAGAGQVQRRSHTTMFGANIPTVSSRSMPQSRPQPPRPQKIARAAAPAPAPAPSMSPDMQFQQRLRSVDIMSFTPSLPKPTALSRSAAPPPPPPATAMYCSAAAPVAQQELSAPPAAPGGGGGGYSGSYNPSGPVDYSPSFSGADDSVDAEMKSGMMAVPLMPVSRKSAGGGFGGFASGLFGSGGSGGGRGGLGSLLSRNKKKKSAPPASAIEAEVDDDEESEEGGLPHQPDPSDPLAHLVATQAFEGFWAWTPALFAALGLTESQVVEAFGKAGHGREVALGNVAATACAVVFLRKRLGAMAEEWEMMAEKAVEWMSSESGIGAEAMAVAEKLF